MRMTFVCLCLSLVFFGFGCSSGGVKTESRKGVRRPPPPPPQAQGPKTTVPALGGEALIAAGQKFFQAKDFQKAYDYFTAAVVRLEANPTKKLEAQYWSMRASSKLLRHSDTVELSQELLKNKAWTEAQLSEVYGYRIQAFESLSDPLSALIVLNAGLTLPLLAKLRDSYTLRANELIQSRLTFDELETVGASEELSAFRAAAYFRLGELSLDDRNLDSARTYFGRVVSISPGSDESRRAQETLAQLDSVRRVEPKTVGLVLPMTGRYASISQKTLRATQMGLGLYGNNVSSFRLAVVDSEGNSDSARRGVEKLVKEDNVIAVIGSVLSRTAPAVASKTSELGVPSIALSQKSGVTELGSSIFRNSLTSEMQVRFLVKTAIEDKGLRRFAVLYPNDQYGIEFANIFWDEVLARGGQITAAQVYSPKETDFRDVVQRLVGTYYLEARADEYKLRLKEWSDAQTKRSARNTPPDDLLPPIADFDAVFIPDSAKAMGQISAMLAYNNVKGVQLLGTNLWNVPGLAKRAGNSAGNLLFVDSYVSTDPVFTNSFFVREYRNQFNEDPGIFELQAYDSALILRQLISQGATSREALGRALSQLKDFPGSLGPLSISSEREIQRPLVALVLENGNVIPLARTTQK
jgi:branched-chain amino acid transport system substrate-binding protein